MKTDQINILGAGLVGTLLSIFLSKKGFSVDVYEKRGDPRIQDLTQGKSINLALSHRGIRALKDAGVYEAVRNELIPMYGRMIHDYEGNLTMQPYGKKGQHINSVSRLGLTEVLISESEKAGARFHFEHRCEAVDLDRTKISLRNTGKRFETHSDVLIGADGAYSVMRRAMQVTDRFNFEQYYIEHGYKEFRISPKNGDYALEPNYLHIWPRGHFMLIALPNPDKSFTTTLFFPFEGEFSFSKIQTRQHITDLFQVYFQDVIEVMPDFVEQYMANPTSSLVTVKCFPWHRKKSLLIGDASHAIVPFYGQGMNAGFEDCRIFSEAAEQFSYDWEKLFPYFERIRKSETDAIADLALKNFVEMRDHVADERFLKIKKLEARLHKHFPEDWLPLYSMVTFSDMPYSKALKIGNIQKKLMDNFPDHFDPEEVALEPIIEKYKAALDEA